RGRPYALVSPDGRIAVRLPDWDLFTAAFELPGSDAFYENHRRIGHWVLLPGAVRYDHAAIREWVRRAHELTAVDVCGCVRRARSARAPVTYRRPGRRGR